MSPYVAGAMKDLPALQQKLLHWLRQRQDLGMVPVTEIARWKAFFAKIPAVATSTFSFEFPRTGILPVAVASSSSSAQLLFLPSGVSAERQSALLSVRGIVSAEQLGPLVEPIPDSLPRSAIGKARRRAGLMLLLVVNEVVAAVVAAVSRWRRTLSMLPTLWISCWLLLQIRSWTCFTPLRLCASAFFAIREPRSASTR